MLTRRNLLKSTGALGIYSIAGTLGIDFLTGCNEKDVDKILSAVNVADQVAKQAKIILDPVNPGIGGLVGTISADLELVEKAYKDYETIVDASAKQSALVLVQGTVSTISTNLAALLEAVHVNTPSLVMTISTAVAIINSAITILVNSLPAQQVTSARSVTIPAQAQLPIVKNAKSSNDLKKLWNAAVEKDYPQAKI